MKSIVKTYQLSCAILKGWEKLFTELPLEELVELWNDKDRMSICFALHGDRTVSRYKIEECCHADSIDGFELLDLPKIKDPKLKEFLQDYFTKIKELGIRWKIEPENIENKINEYYKKREFDEMMETPLTSEQLAQRKKIVALYAEKFKDSAWRKL